MMRFGIGAGEDERRHPVGQHRRLARAGAGDDQQRPRPFGPADPVLDRESLLGVEVDQGRCANQGEGHGAKQSCFALCSQERDFPARRTDGPPEFCGQRIAS